MDLATGILDLALVLLGGALGFSARFKTPMLLTMFLIKVIKWWFDTHPQGREIAKKSNLDEEFKSKFVNELAALESKFGKVDSK